MTRSNVGGYAARRIKGDTILQLLRSRQEFVKRFSDGTVGNLTGGGQMYAAMSDIASLA